MNLEDIAKLAGVSRSTVSRVVNNDPNVSERSRALVQATIDRVGYRPNAAARALASHRSHALGLLVPEDFAQNHVDAWYPLIIEAILTATRDADQSLVLIMEDTFSPDASARLISQFVHSGRVDGLLLLQHSYDDYLTLELLKHDIPTVLIAESDIPGTCWVDNDNRAGGAILGRMMKERGVASACAVTAMLAHVPSRRRIEGFQREIPRTQIVLTSHSVQSAEELIRPLLATNHPEAIFAVNGWIAPVIYRVADQLGIDIPGDMIVAAFDDFDPEFSQRVGLTSVPQHVSQLAKHAVDLLIDRVEGRAPPGQTIVLDSPLVQRGSCNDLAFTQTQGGVPAT